MIHKGIRKADWILMDTAAIPDDAGWDDQMELPPKSHSEEKGKMSEDSFKWTVVSQ